MRKLLIILTILLASTKCYADVTTEILSQQKAPNGDMWVCVQYMIDGVEVQSPYPKVNGKSCFMIRKNAYQLAGLNTFGIEALFDKEIKEHAETLIADEYSNKAIGEIINNINLVGRKQTVLTAVRKVTPEKEWTVRSNGTKIEKIVAVESVVP